MITMRIMKKRRKIQMASKKKMRRTLIMKVMRNKTRKNMTRMKKHVIKVKTKMTRLRKIRTRENTTRCRRRSTSTARRSRRLKCWRWAKIILINRSRQGKRKLFKLKMVAVQKKILLNKVKSK